MKHNTYLFALALFLILTSSLAGNAQTTYSFTYDASGNRTARTIVLTKVATIPKDSLLAKEQKKPLDDQIGLQRTRIYPNPTKGLLRIDFPELSDSEPIIRVYDPSGRLIVQETAISTGNEVDLSAHPPGFYIMVIHIGQAKKEWKIIKE